mmetsp:Transcript_7522/g.10337  ORF Transcript_7522/g.10337 Transcript_7522/m.10337 type:complete len:94 (+) Transcript_7522:143-424(+)
MQHEGRPVDTFTSAFIREGYDQERAAAATTWRRTWDGTSGTEWVARKGSGVVMATIILLQALTSKARRPLPLRCLTTFRSQIIFSPSAASTPA